MQSKDLDVVERLMLIPKEMVVAVDEGTYLPLGKLVHEAALVIVRLRRELEEKNDRD